MPHDPQTHAFLLRVKAAGTPPWSAMTVEQARIISARTVRLASLYEPVSMTEERRIPGPAGEIRIRLYAASNKRLLPVLVYFHGGGWVLGDLDSVDSQMRSIANRVECLVISVNYHLAPEYRFPATVEDAYTVLAWVSKQSREINADATRIAVAGDSAGGNIAAAVALMAKDRGQPSLVFQVLIYPALNNDFNTSSYIENGEGYGITTADSQWFWNHYLHTPEDAQNPYAAPLRAVDLSGVPPALIITAEYDPLRDEGEVYAHRLREAGVPVQFHNYEGMIHGFFQLGSIIDVTMIVIDEVASTLRSIF